jgi:O-acetyl-ADP-ribose deacetylase (regulator of RNase III)
VVSRPIGETASSAYRSCLALCSTHGIAEIALPSISTGAYGYPLEEAAPVALRAVAEYLTTHAELTLVRFVLFDRVAYAAYDQALGVIRWQGSS